MFFGVALGTVQDSASATGALVAEAGAPYGLAPAVILFRISSNPAVVRVNLGRVAQLAMIAHARLSVDRRVAVVGASSLDVSLFAAK